MLLHACNSAYCGVAVHGLFSPLLSPVSLLGYEVGVWGLLAILTFPISFLKQCVSVLQLVVACKNIAALDEVQRSRRPDTS